MEVEFQVNREHCHATGMFHLKHFKCGCMKAIIELYGAFCPECKFPLLDADDYANILEHELIELYCAIACYDDGLRKWNGHGFNQTIRSIFPQHKVIHKTNDHITEMKYG